MTDVTRPAGIANGRIHDALNSDPEQDRAKAREWGSERSRAEALSQAFLPFPSLLLFYLYQRRSLPLIYFTHVLPESY